MLKFDELLDHAQVCLMLDFYGELLTTRAKTVLELYYQEDMSLSEIAGEMAISRQGVHDKIRQGVRSLMEYESRLKLLEKYLQQKSLISNALDLLQNEQPDEVRKILLEMLENL